MKLKKHQKTFCLYVVTNFPYLIIRSVKRDVQSIIPLWFEFKFFIRGFSIFSSRFIGYVWSYRSIAETSRNAKKSTLRFEHSLNLNSKRNEASQVKPSRANSLISIQSEWAILFAKSSQSSHFQILHHQIGGLKAIAFGETNCLVFV